MAYQYPSDATPEQRAEIDRLAEQLRREPFVPNDNPGRRGGDEVSERAFGPKSADHPSIGEKCPACHEPFTEGDYTTLVALGPGNDPEARERMRQGRPYNVVAIEVHYGCANGQETEGSRQNRHNGSRSALTAFWRVGTCDGGVNAGKPAV